MRENRMLRLKRRELETDLWTGYLGTSIGKPEANCYAFPKDTAPALDPTCTFARKYSSLAVHLI